MFRKVLIANRGEIAVRVIRACGELGVHTVAVFSEVDRNALHVRYADEAYPIGPAPASESYLRIERIIEVATACGAQAIHPGYGFLSENADFARACEEAQIAFIGPSPETIALVGDKVAARRLAHSADVATVPGSQEDVGDEEALAAASEMGFPVMIKAAAGGGGKGMRLVGSEKEMPSALRGARHEARQAFGDGRIYVEKVVAGARHVEVQILGDEHGNLIHLGERECSIQRRHQKLLEESPSTALTPELREAMGQAAVRVARAAGYANAGTVEFLLDEEGRFYFLEVNARLQVEHPVTEMVTGIDIVKEQLRIASGRKLRYRQEDVRWGGHALECRITAEDPFNNFMPSVGRITTLVEPTGHSVRVENGVYEGCEVSLYYDPLIAKLIVWGENRAEAILRMRRALSEYRILGVHTTIPFHLRLLDSTQFLLGRYDTSFLESRFRPEAVERQREEVAAIAATLLAHQRRRQAIAMPQRARDSQSPWKMAGRREALRD